MRHIPRPHRRDPFLPPDETGIFSAAMLLATAPAVEEPKAERMDAEPPEPPEEKPLPKARLDAAKKVAERLNKIRGRQVEIANAEDLPETEENKVTGSDRGM